MHAQLRISTTAKDTKSTKLARPVEADSKILTLNWLPAGLESGICCFGGGPTCMLGARVIEIQREGHSKTGQMNWLLVMGLVPQIWAWPLFLARSGERIDLNLTLQSKFSVLAVVCCRFQGWRIWMHSFKTFWSHISSWCLSFKLIIDRERHLADLLPWYFFFCCFRFFKSQVDCLRNGEETRLDTDSFLCLFWCCVCISKWTLSSQILIWH